MTQAALTFENNKAIENRKDSYLEVIVDSHKVIKSWRQSLYAYEWITPEGRIKTKEELSEKEQLKRVEIESALEKQSPLEKPILGIGLLENIEIGSGRATFLTLADRGIKEIPVHIPKSAEKEFSSFFV